MRETAGAVKEVAKTAGLAIKTVDRLGQFFSKVMGESVEATCGMLADTLKYKRWERQTILVEKAERLIKEKNLSNRLIPISAKLVLPIFQNASLEDDDFLHDLYAKLLVSAIDPDVQTRRTAFVQILRQLEPLDVQILQAMHAINIKRGLRYKDKETFLSKPPTRVLIRKRDFLQHLPVNTTEYWKAVDNLCRLGLVESYFAETLIGSGGGDSLPDSVVASYGGYNNLCITALGVAFAKICNY